MTGIRFVGNVARICEESRRTLAAAQNGITPQQLQGITESIMKPASYKDTFTQGTNKIMEEAKGNNFAKKALDFVKTNATKVADKFKGLSKGGKAGVIAAGAAALVGIGTAVGVAIAKHTASNENSFPNSYEIK